MNHVISSRYKNVVDLQDYKNAGGISIIRNNILSEYSNKKLPYDIHPSILNSFQGQYEFRDRMINLQGYAVITEKLCSELAKFIEDRKVLEVMSGKGTLTKGLRDQGIIVKATDNYSWCGTVSPGEFFENRWIEDLENIDAVEAIKKYGKDYHILLMSWAPMDKIISYEVLQEMRKVNPNMFMIFIGEDQGGCCACDEFFDNAKYIEDKTINYINRNIFRKHGFVHDRIYLFN